MSQDPAGYIFSIFFKYRISINNIYCILAKSQSHVWSKTDNCIYVISLISSYLYQIAHLGDDDEEPEFSSTMHLEEGDTFLFQPRTLKNLVVVDEMDSLSPITHCQVCHNYRCSRLPM